MEVVYKKAATKADDEGAVRAAITALPAAYCAIGERLHAITTAGAPVLVP